nr:hypothetical protein [uncultured Arsenicibacter sp.]
MKKFIVTEISLIANLLRIGLLRYFENTELQFLITDFCYNHSSAGNERIIQEKNFAVRLKKTGLLSETGLNEQQMSRLYELSRQHSPRFLIKTVSALVLAESTGYPLITEDDLLRDVAAKEMKLKSHNQEWLLTDLVHEVSIREKHITLELIKELL